MSGALNTLPVAPQVRAPRAVVRVNGSPLPGWIEWEVDNNNHREADTFRVSFACGALPATLNAGVLSGLGAIQVEILAGFPGDPLNFSASELDSLILGNADALRYKPARGVIEITGRDLTAEMLDAKTSETFANRKASDIAAAIAGRHGLGAVVDDTGGLDGTYYEIDHRRLNNAASEWDLLCELADLYNFTVKVRGQTLFFQRAGSAAGGNYVIEWIAPGGAVGYPVSNAIELEFTRNSMLGQKAVKVSVGSFNAKQKTRFLDSATANRAKASGNGVLEYSYNVPGLTADQCKAVAAARLGGIMRNEMVLCAVLPGDALLDADMIVTVVGTGTAFDQDYYAMSVNRRMSAEEGYVMRLEAKNHAPETEVDD